MTPGPRAPQRQRGRDRVAGLLAAAASLFVEKGYDATTMTEIAGRAGGSIGSLYLFFPSKPALAQALLLSLAEQLGARVEGLQAQVEGRPPAFIADALFGELSHFLAANPVYAALMDLPGEDGWRQQVRARRRQQIAALFAQARPALPPAQAERMAVIVPQMMRIALTGSDTLPRQALMDELRLMLRAHLRQSTLG